MILQATCSPPTIEQCWDKARFCMWRVGLQCCFSDITCGPPMVTVDKDKPCSWVGDVDYAFFRGLLGTSAQLLLVVPSALAVLQCFTTMGHDL